MRNLILKILLFLGFVASLALYFSDVQTIIPTLALLFGLGNIYFTTKRSIKFIYFDLLWIIFTIITLYGAVQYTDLILYVFYIFIGVYQYFNWKSNLNAKSGETKTQSIEFKKDIMYVIYGLMMSICILLLFPNSSNALLGALISGLGISASVALAKRRYFSEVIFTFVNLMQIYLMFVIDLYALAVIPFLFLCNTLVFLVFNRKNAI